MPSTNTNMRFGKNLPRVTEYVRNLGKSVAYSTVDYFKGTMEDTSDFIETNQEIFKDIYHAARDYRATMKAVDRSIRSSKVYEAGQGLKKSLFESIRTGKFYDTERESEYSLKASGEMGNVGDMDEWGSSDEFDINMDDESFDESDVGKSTSIVTGAIQDATISQANIIAKSTEYLAESEKASTKLLFGQGERLYASVNAGMSGIQSMLSRVNSFMDGPMTTHMENSTKFYQEITNKMNEVTAMMKESLEMQRNLYHKEQKRFDDSQWRRVGTSPDLAEYGKAIQKNFMEFLGPEAQMLLGNDMGEGSNMLLAMVANPLKFIPDLIVKTLIPATIKKSLSSLDKTFTGLFSNLIARLNNWGDENSDAPGFLKILGKIFGLKMDSKTSFDTSRYEKGPVPFDGVTKKAITEVIPGYLSRIESALVSGTERVFDFNSGKWVTISDIEKEFKNRKGRRIRDGAYEVAEDLRNEINELKKHDAKAAKELQENADKLFKKIYEDNGAFDPYRPHGFGEDKEDPWDYYDIDKDTFLNLAELIVGSTKEGKRGRKQSAMGLAAAMQDARESYSRYLRDSETNDSTIRHLFSGAYSGIDLNSETVTARSIRTNNIINNATDKYNKNIFYYLRGMYAELMYIRYNGGRFGSANQRGGPTNPVDPFSGGGGYNPLTSLERLLGNEVDAEAATIAANAARDADAEEDFDETSWMNARRDEQVMREKNDRNAGRKLRNSDKGFLSQLLEAGSLGEKFKVITQNINYLMEKPGLAIAGVIDTADKRLFQLVFGSKEGEEITDSEGRTVKGFLDYLISRTRETFDKMNDWIDDHILDPIKKKLGVESFADLFKMVFDRLGWTDKFNSVKDWAKKQARPVIDRLKFKGKNAWGTFTGAMDNTYGRLGRAMGLGGLTPEEAAIVTPIVDNPEGIDYDAIAEWNNPNGFAARGGLVTRRGLVVISPGEKIVPIGGRVTQRNNLTAEKAFARRFGIRGAGFYATGTETQPIQETERDVIEATIRRVTSEVTGNKENKGIANVIASGLIGGGVSLVTGLIGGPLLGAAVGSAFGIAQNSETVQKWLFGEEVVNSNGEKERTGGVITKEMQEKFKQYFPSIKDFGIAGAVAGLFTPFGIVGGLLAGSAIGFAKETDTFQEFVFGKKDENGERDGGLIKKEFREKLKKAAPSMATGVIAGALLGPFGLLGNAVLGSALGFVTTTDQFKNFVFGKQDEDGKRHGGLVEALYTGIVKPFVILGKTIVEDGAKFVNNKMLKPLENFSTAFMQMIKNGLVSIKDSVKDHLQNMMDKTIGRPLQDFLEHTIFDNARKWMGRILKIPVTLAKGIISAPFAALGAIGNNIRTTQIAKGTAGDMTAQQRLDWRESHRFRMFGRELTGHDAFRGLDEKLANMKGSEGVERMEQLREQLKIYLDTKGEMGKQVADLVRRAGEITSEFFNTERAANDSSISIYTAVGGAIMKKIFIATSKGKIDPIARICSQFVNAGFMTSEQAADYLNQIAPYIEQIQDKIEKRKNASKYQRQLQARLSELTGGALKDTKTIRRFNRLLSGEIDARRAELAEDAANGGDAANESIPDVIDRSTSKLLDALNEINENLKLNRMSPRERARYLRSRGGSNTGSSTNSSSSTSSDGASAIDDMLVGTQRDAVDVLNNSYHTVETEDGAQALADSSGRIISSRSASIVRRSMRERAQNEEDERNWREKLNDSFFGRAVGGITKFLGGAKSGIFGLLGSVLNKAAPFFTWMKWLFIGGTAIAATGHASGLVKDILWPFVRDKIGPWFIGTRNEDGVLQGGLRGIIFGNKNVDSGEYEGGLVSGLTNKFASWFETTPVYSVMNKIKEIYKEKGLMGFVEPVVDWYVTGFEKVGTNIVTPLVSAFVKNLPELAKDVAIGVIDGISGWFGWDKKTGDVRTDSDGNKYINPTLAGAKSYTNTTSTTSNQNIAGSSLGLTKQSTNTFFTDENGNYVFKNNETGDLAVRQMDANGNIIYTYSDGTVETNPNASFSLVKENEYSKYGANATLLGTLASGTANNFLAGLANYNLTNGSKTLPMFKSSGILKNFRKSVTSVGPLKKLYNIAAFTGKSAWNTVSSIGSSTRTLGDKIRTFGTDVAETSSDTTRSSGIISKAVDKLKSIFGRTAETVSDAATNTDSAADAIRTVTEAAADVTDSSGFISKIKTGIINFFGRIAENKVVKGLLSGVAKIFGTSIDDILIEKGFKEAGELFAKKVGDNVVKSSLKSLANSLAVIPIATIALAITYFVSGWNDAHNIFGIAKDIDIPMTYNLVAGLVNAVKNALPGIGIILGFVPTSVIIDIFVDHILPIFGWDDSSLKSMQEESQKLMDEYNATVGADKQVTSIEDYNDATNPGILTKIKQTANVIGGSIASGVKNIVNNVTKTGQSIYSSRFGFSRHQNHLYQNAANLARKRFGKSTIGEAGCGPVAATNLLNRLAGMGPGMDIDSASKIASFYTDASGGTTMDYFTDILNANGYPASETSSKDALLSSIASGNPAVLLGNSGKESGTPFGANNHYINAMGIDKSGRNMIVEDPDLPQSIVKYPIKDVMKDTISGVATGFGRKIANYFKLRKKSPLAGKAKESTVTVSKIALRAVPILYTGESGGDYSAINPNDNGAISIGLIQWHGGRARRILAGIIGQLGTSESIKILGQNLYNKIMNKSDSDWDSIYVSKNSAEYNAIKSLLSTEASKSVQNAQAVIDINDYITSIKKLGVKDENAIIFMCHLKNAYGRVKSKFLDAAAKTAGSVANIKLDDIYNACLADSYYNNNYGVNGYARKIYNAIVNSEPVGDTTTTIDASNLVLDTASTASTVEELSNIDSTSTDSNILSAISSLGTNMFKRIYGDEIANFLGVGSSSNEESSGDTGTLSGWVMANLPSTASASQKQTALVQAMQSIKGKIAYSLDGPQDPDKGSASCASTVGWAYRKVLGVTGMSASASTQSKDSRFTDVIRLGQPGTAPGKTFNLSALQPGDIVYMKNPSSNHTEMYIGNGQDLSHGGPGYGPELRTLDADRQKKVFAVRRYNDFIDTSGRGRKRIDRKNIGYARIDSSTIQKANSAIQRYGIDSKLISQQTSSDMVYAQYFSAMITLLSVIADNTEALSSLQSALAERGTTISSADLQKAAGNARKRVAKARQAQNALAQNAGGFIDFGDATDMQNILNGPTGYIVRTMEALAKE